MRGLMEDCGWVFLNVSGMANGTEVHGMVFTSKRSFLTKKGNKKRVGVGGQWTSSGRAEMGEKSKKETKPERKRKVTLFQFISM